jgi:hypothetical protein
MVGQRAFNLETKQKMAGSSKAAKNVTKQSLYIMTSMIIVDARKK